MKSPSFKKVKKNNINKIRNSYNNTGRVLLTLIFYNLERLLYFLIF